MNNENKKYDLFISHASEDKDTVVRELANILKNYGLSVWYDEFSLSLGDSLSKSIDFGLSNSSYGIIILSKSFLQKPWPEYEFRGLLAREIGKDKLILPIWYNIKRDDLLNFSPSLADRFALDASRVTFEKISIEVLKIVRPDLLQNYLRRKTFENQIKNAKTEYAKPSELAEGPILHNELPDRLITRIRLIRAVLFQCHPHSMENWIDGFQRDTHPSHEISWWEHLAAVFSEYIHFTNTDPKDYENLFYTIFLLCNGQEDQIDPNHLQKFNKNINLKLMTKSLFPPFDIEDEEKSKPIDDSQNSIISEYLNKFDLEDFSKED